MSRRCFVCLVSLLLVPASAAAVDGVIEINQARATEGGVTPGDTAGFPVTIDTSGSYRLTSDLSPGPAESGIEITAGKVTLDLNGFGLLGSLGELPSDGINITGENVEIRNGTVRDFVTNGIVSTANRSRVIDLRVSGSFTGYGIRLNLGENLVDRCTVHDNGDVGVGIGPRSLVVNSVITSNVSLGIVGASAVGYGGNMISDNNGGGANAQTQFANEIGGNICGTNTTCP